MPRRILRSSMLLALVAATAPAEAAGGLACLPDPTTPVARTEVIPKEIPMGGKFVVAFSIVVGIPHPAQFWVVPPGRPGSESLIVVDDGLEGAVMSEEEFLSCDTVEIDTSLLKGVTWDENGNPLQQRIFAEKGRYTLYFADNLWTELDNTVFEIHHIELR